ncbi:MAG: hypothetical protein KKD74_14050 [Bacteroidetes bacterium]|nr:hypothetical protein [Bacteroidota bacterium]
MYEDSNQLLYAIRSHWLIENNAHWSLDVIFYEDSSRKKARHAAINNYIINMLEVSVIRNENFKKIALKANDLLAGWSQDRGDALKKVIQKHQKFSKKYFV